MSKKIFISYNFKDKQFAGSVKSFFQKQGGKCQGSPVYVTNDVSAGGSDAIDAEIKRVMKPCEAILFIVGDNSHNSPWINREAKLAISLGLGLVAIQIPNTHGGIANELKEVKVPFVEWDHDTLCHALNKAWRVGKSTRQG